MIRRGEPRGTAHEEDVGKSNGSLVHIIYNDFGADARVDYLQPQGLGTACSSG